MNESSLKLLASMYAALIKAGRRTMEDVPAELVDAVKLGLGEEV